jgi:hypothetical protein
VSLLPLEQPATLLQRHPALRWLAPVGVLGIAALVIAEFVAGGSSDPTTLPATTPAALVTEVQHPTGSQYSGTLVARASLGVPDLGTLTTNNGSAQGTIAFAQLLSGSHTLQYWYGGATKQRLALLGSTAETDLFLDGADLWEWNSLRRTAVHSTVTDADAAGQPVPATNPAALTPVSLARDALAAIDSQTTVSVHDSPAVADQPAYELRIEPTSTDTKIGSVRIAVDGATKVPLRVRVYARGASSPALDVGFTSIHYATQTERNFDFSPPRGARVTEGGTVGGPTGAGLPGVTMVGSGWTSVAGATLSSSASSMVDRFAAFVGLNAVSGSWGRGQLLDSPLLSLLVTEDGRIYVGAVAAGTLYSAAATH